MVPWNVRNRWDNYVAITRQMNFIVTHVFREGNCCADRLANIGLSINIQIVPDQARGNFIRNRLGLPVIDL